MSAVGGQGFENALIVADLCETHRSLLVHGAGYGPDDTWRALIIVTQIALMQGMTADTQVYAKVDGQVGRIHELGCMACYKPDKFGEIVETAKKHDLSDIKRLGEKWVFEASKRSDDDGVRH